MGIGERLRATKDRLAKRGRTSDPTLESFATPRDDVAELAARVDESARAAHELPHRRPYLLLVHDFLRRLLDLHLELVDEVERELAPGSRPSVSGAGSSGES